MEIKKVGKNTKSHVDKFLFLVPLSLVAMLCISVALVPEQTNNLFNKIFGIVTGDFGWMLQMFFVANTMLMLYFIFGKYANKPIGKGEPEFSTPVWYVICCRYFRCSGLLGI